MGGSSAVSMKLAQIHFRLGVEEAICYTGNFFTLLEIILAK